MTLPASIWTCTGLAWVISKLRCLIWHTHTQNAFPFGLQCHFNVFFAVTFYAFLHPNFPKAILFFWCSVWWFFLVCFNVRAFYLLLLSFGFRSKWSSFWTTHSLILVKSRPYFSSIFWKSEFFPCTGTDQSQSNITNF